MNRAELRRQKRQKEKYQKVYTLTYEDIQRIKHQATLDAMSIAFVCMCSIAISTARDLLGFGRIRIGRFMDRMMLKYEAYMEDQLDKTLTDTERYDFDTMIKFIKEETGYDILAKLNEVNKIT